MNEVLYNLIQIVVIASMIIIMRYLVPFLRVRLQSVIDAEIWKMIVKEVKSVEQTMTMGKVKKEEVIVRVTSWANNHGIKITQEQISNLIEAAVFVMKKEG